MNKKNKTKKHQKKNNFNKINIIVIMHRKGRQNIEIRCKQILV